MKTERLTLLLVVVCLLTLGACMAAPEPPDGQTNTSESQSELVCESTDAITLQLKWVAQAQFAGYYAAAAEGYYADECLDVTINPGGPDIVPEQVVAGGQAQFGINFVPSLLSAREQGTNLVNVAQIFERSAMREIAWSDSGVESPEDLRGRRVAVWFGGNEFELLATLAKYDIDKDTDVELVQQPFDMNLLLERDVAAAAAMTYNELAQVLETTDPDTGELYQLEQLNVIDFNEEGTAMLQDGIFTTEEWLTDSLNQNITVRFLRASFKGWIFCRDNLDRCVDYVLEQGPALPRGHQTWMMNEVNNLIWPSTSGIGQMDADVFQQTADIALAFGVIAQSPSDGAYVTEFAQAALEGINMDTMGDAYRPATIEITAGGQ